MQYLPLDRVSLHLPPENHLLNSFLSNKLSGIWFEHFIAVLLSFVFQTAEHTIISSTTSTTTTDKPPTSTRIYARRFLSSPTSSSVSMNVVYSLMDGDKKELLSNNSYANVSHQADQSLLLGKFYKL